MSGQQYKGSTSIHDEARRLQLLAEMAGEATSDAFRDLKRSGFEPEHVVDFGCGTGEALPIISSSFPLAHVVGLDGSADAAAVAKKKNPSVTLLTANMITADFGELFPNGIDLAFFRTTLLHIPDRRALLQKVMQSVRSGGYLMVQESDWSVSDANWPEYLQFKEAFVSSMRSHGISPTIGSELNALFMELGLKNVVARASSKKVTPNDEAWQILYALIEVTRSNTFDSFRQIFDRAAQDPNNYFTTPTWVVCRGQK